LARPGSCRDLRHRQDRRPPVKPEAVDIDVVISAQRCGSDLLLLVDNHHRQHGVRGIKMKILRAVLLASAVGIGAVVPATAQQAAPAASPEALQAAKELIAVLSPDMIKDMNNKMFAQMWPSFEQGLQAQFSSLDAATMDELKGEIRSVMEKELNTEMSTLVETMPAVYAKYMTVDEMHAIREFYRTPAGAKVLKVMPEIMSESMAGFAPHLQSMMQRLNVSILAILQKHSLGPKAQ
jgi:uncharacterized protein